MADIGNPIHFGDLFHGDVESGLDGLITKVESVEESLLKMIKDVKKEASTLGEALSGTSSASKGERDMTSQYAAEIEKLHSANERLSQSLTKVRNDLSALRKQKSNDKDDTISLANSYSTLSGLIAETGVNIDELLQSEKQLNIAKKNGETANKSLEGSYNKLYAQYNLIKNVLNAMGNEMRNNEAIGKKWEAQALSIMNTMKSMQEATGRNTLSVGDYGKALNGLSISTQQVLREMPTLANSVSQFFIAISNNVPIFVDNLKRVQQETGSWAMAMKGVMTSLFSWQTALLVVLTILPKIAKAIHDKRKAQDEDNKSTKKQIEYLHLVHEAMVAVIKAETENITKIRTLIAITKDYNRSEQDRITAAQVLKQTYDEQLANYSAEEIALGKAKGALDDITISLVKQAKARALLNKITEAYIGQIDSEDKMLAAGQTRVYEYGYKNVKGLYDRVQELIKATGMSEEQIKKSIAFTAKQDKGIWKAYDAYKAAKKEIAEYGKTIDDLTKRIPVEGLLEDILTGGRKGREKLEEDKNFFWEWLTSYAKVMEDEADRAITLVDIEYAHRIDNMEKELVALKEKHKLTEQQERYLTEIIVNLEKERQTKRAEVIKEYYDKTWKEISKGYDNQINDEIDTELALSNIHARIIADISNKVIESREKLNDKLENGTFREAKKEGKIYNNLLKEKLRIEAETQKEILEMRRFTGELTQDEYDKELAKLIIARDKAIAKLDKTRRRRFDLRTLIFGESKEDGNGHVYKELDEERKAFLDAFEESMNLAFDYMNEWMDKRIEMAQVAIDAAQKEREAAKETYDYEQEARVNGYANNVELARREYEEKLALERKAIEEKQRLEKIQEAINTATQISSLVTATAELWAAHASIPLVGVALATIATAAMWGSFAAAKIQAAQLTSTKYGDGMSEYLDYGGSHASGNDIDFGRDKYGRQRRVERGEMIGVINKRNVEKYGVNRITDIIDSLNKGTFDRKYNTSAETEAINQLIMRQSIMDSLGIGGGVIDSLSTNSFDDKYGLAFNGFSVDGTDLSLVERGINRLIEQGETRIVSTHDGRIEYKGNNKRIIHNS